MGFPHPTVDIPGAHPDTAVTAERVFADPFGHAADLVSGAARNTVTAGHLCATNWVLDRTGQHLLLTTHRVLGWSVPGGHVERGETTMNAALRELAEETGLTRDDVDPLIAVPLTVHATDLSGDRPHRHWNIAYAWRTVGDPRLRAEPDAQLRWWPLDSLPMNAPADLTPISELLTTASR